MFDAINFIYCPAGLFASGPTLLGRVEFAFIEHRPSLVILFFITEVGSHYNYFLLTFERFPIKFGSSDLTFL
jgi:hypothetical protein